MSAPSIAGRIAVEGAAGRDTSTGVVRVLAGRLGRGVVYAWACWLTLVTIMRIGLAWPKFVEGVGIAKRVTVRGRNGEVKQRLVGVPKIGRWESSAYTAAFLVRLPHGHDLKTWQEVASPMRHSFKVQQVRVSDRADVPGFVRIDVLRRDPLETVKITPHAVDRDRFVVANKEDGTSDTIDFRMFPHYLLAGATGSGKSVLLRSLVTALAPTDDVIVAWDLKWGLEASVFGARLSAICETAPQVQASVNTIIGIAQQRVALFKQAGVTNIGEFEARTGVHLRRIRVIVDEVAELAIGAPDDVVDLTATDVDLAAQAKKFNEQLKIASTLNDFLLGQVLRIVQLVRFAGINVVLCGQRFGSDLGAKITAIRAQLPGRLCCGLNDRQTAEMTLPGMDAEVHARALSFHREGLYIAKGKGQAWHISRPPFTTVEQARHTCQVHAGNSIPLHQVPADDLDRTQQLIQQGENR